MSKIAIIGYGNVGYHLANRLSRRNDVSIFSRTAIDDEVMSMDELESDDYEFIIICVPDGVVKEVADSFETEDAVVMHTSGARPLSDIAKHPRHGVLYPLQTMSRNKELDFSTIPIFIEGNEEGEMKVYSLARTIGNDVRLITSANRAKLHLAAVFACNFSNHMYHISEMLLKDLDMKFQDISPLVEETFKKAVQLDPSNSQTGPAIRDDQLTISNHLEMMKDEKMKNIYQLLTENIQSYK